ncbi:alanine racemase [Streptomyces sp. 3N207]|uniref:alanine racemase n=1 Tax=Streptomyces sp. 3N207 TaxID=3457417 RepID=UPI003FD544BC
MDTAAAPPVPALPDPAAEAVLRSGLPAELAYAFGGPFHFLLPDAFDANLSATLEVFAETGVEGKVYYAKKANKAAVWVERCAAAGCGVDVASLGELREALGHGVPGDQLVVTGPAKAAALHELAVRHRALIAVDSLDELDALIGLVETGRTGPARILLRCLPTSQPHSRFGLDAGQLAAALEMCTRGAEAVRLEGFSFHLSGYALQPRADLAAELIGHCYRARALGLGADRISIGGGLPTSYTEDHHFKRYLSEQHSGHYHAQKSFSAGDFYPYHSPTPGAQALRELLALVPDGHEQPLSGILKDGGITLLMEPGRALLHQAGATVFEVQGVKERDGYLLVTVNGTSLSLSEQWFNSEYLPDPVLLDSAGDEVLLGPAEAEQPVRRGPDRTCAAAVGAATCLESDMLSWRKVRLPRPPRPGDLLVYPDTAGYQMDSNESPFHDLPLPAKVVIDRTDRARPRWRLDRHFH